MLKIAALSIVIAFGSSLAQEVRLGPAEIGPSTIQHLDADRHPKLAASSD